MCSGRSATCPSVVSWAGVITPYLERDAPEQQAGQLEEGVKDEDG